MFKRSRYKEKSKNNFILFVKKPDKVIMGVRFTIRFLLFL